MRAALWTAVRDEIERQATEVRAVLEPNRKAVEQLATELLEAGSLSGDALVAALRRSGIAEGRMSINLGQRNGDREARP